MILGSLDRVEREFGNGIKALGPLDLDIREGELLSLLGPSGCGKSTALKIIAGLLPPTAGKVTWTGGKPAMGFVFQEATLMPWATVRENIRLPLTLARGLAAYLNSTIADTYFRTFSGHTGKCW